jgi:hypothetical protein
MRWSVVLADMNSGKSILAAVVIVHLAVSIVHGIAHGRAPVLLSAGATLFVVAVILIGPILGLIVYAFWLPRTGAWIVAVTMAGAFAFGLVNHFLISGSDHVSHVPAPWRMMFGITAALLAVIEAAGSALALRHAMRR